MSNTSDRIGQIHSHVCSECRRMRACSHPAPCREYLAEHRHNWKCVECRRKIEPLDAMLEAWFERIERMAGHV